MGAQDEKVARRYAKALFELCAPFHENGKELDITRVALEVFAKSWKVHPEFREAVLNPAIPLSRRIDAVREKGKLIAPSDPVFANFLTVLLDNGRLAMIGTISHEFARMVEAFRRVLALEVTSAMTLTDEEKSRIQSDIQAKVPAQYASLVSIEWRVDPEILGGLRIKVGDKLLDSSIRGSLERIERDLNAIGGAAGKAGASGAVA